MSALACLRIMIDPVRAAAGGEALAALVNKVAASFLECRWLWPRRFGEIAPYAFLLTDARVARLNPQELVALSDELQQKLFGTEGRGTVRLALFEGSQDAVSAFASLDSEIVWDLLENGGEIDRVGGRVTEINWEGARVVSPPDEAGDVVRAQPPVSPPPALDTGYRAVWHGLKQIIVGNAVAARRGGASFSIVDGPLGMPLDASVSFDTICMSAAHKAVQEANGLILLPISFSSMVQRQTREFYLEPLGRLPAAARGRLVAAVYDVPRAPSFSALIKLKTLLDPYFGGIDLQTADPAFRIEDLSSEIATGVTLSLPNADEATRLAAAARFMAKAPVFKRQRIWPAITNVRTVKELEHCVRLRTPFLSGRAISERLDKPADPTHCGIAQLPYAAQRRGRAPAAPVAVAPAG